MSGIEHMLRRTDAAVLHGPHDIRVEEIDVPAPGTGEVLIEMASGGICGSDMHYFAEGKNGQNELRAPSVLGHEAAGVVRCGGPSTTITVGTAVVIEPAIPCDTCSSCRSGRYNICPNGSCFGSPPTNGLFTRFAVIPQAATHVLPDSIPVEIAAVIEPLAVAVWAVKRADLSEGQRLLITGAGPIGRLVAEVASAYGVEDITITDVNDDRLAAARAHGVPNTVNTSSRSLDLTGVDRLIECSGNSRALSQGIYALRPAARAVVVGQAPASVDGLPLAFLQRNEIDLVSAFRYAGTFPEAISLAATGKVALSDIVTNRYPFERIADALLAPTADPMNLKVLVTY